MNRLLINVIVFALTLGFGLTSVWLLTCSGQPVGDQEVQVIPFNSTLPPAELSNEAPNLPQIETSESIVDNLEYFVDQRRIGRPGKNKIEVRCFDRGGDRVTEIRFYSRNRTGTWKQKQSFHFTNDYPLDCDPKIRNFNNDLFGDLTYQSDVAARGANEIRKLFIYDKERDELVYIKNSEDYPNLDYNKKLDCIDAWLVYGATSTVFLSLEGDRLREFASVSTGNERVVTITNEYGKRRVIYRKKMNPNSFEQIYWRFTTFNPPQ